MVILQLISQGTLWFSVLWNRTAISQHRGKGPIWLCEVTIYHCTWHTEMLLRKKWVNGIRSFAIVTEAISVNALVGSCFPWREPGLPSRLCKSQCWCFYPVRIPFPHEENPPLICLLPWLSRAMGKQVKFAVPMPWIQTEVFLVPLLRCSMIKTTPGVSVNPQTNENTMY